MAIQRRTAATAGPAAIPAQQAGAGAGPAPVPNGGGAMSLNPEDWTQGGLLDDVDVVFQQCRFVEFDYGGAAEKPVLALHVIMAYDDNGRPATVDQYYSAGDLSKFFPTPADQGRTCTSAGSAKGLNSNTNCALLLKSVFDAGFPVAKLGPGDVSQMDGMLCHINRVPQPKRGGNISEKNSAGYDKTVAIVTKIHRMPWETSAAKVAARPVAAAMPAPSPAAVAAAPAPEPQQVEQVEAAPLDDEAAGILIQVLSLKNNQVSKTAITPACFKHVAAHPQRADILKLLTDDNWLASMGANYGWTYNNGVVKTAA